MRENYALTDATHDTLTDNVKAISLAWKKSLRHVYKILSEETNDPFAMFLSLYRAACKAGVSTSHWDSDLEFERQRTISKLPAKEVGACFVAQIQKQNRTIERYMEATQDGELSLEELNELENMLIAERDAISLSLQGIKLKREKLQSSSNLRPVG
jgi:hypothetical protein